MNKPAPRFPVGLCGPGPGQAADPQQRLQGPTTFHDAQCHVQAALDAEDVEGHKAAAEQFMADLKAWLPTAKKQKLPSGAAAQSGFAASAAAAGTGPGTAQHCHAAVRPVFSTACLGGPGTAGPSSATDFDQPKQLQQQLSRAHSQPMLLDQQQHRAGRLAAACDGP